MSRSFSDLNSYLRCPKQFYFRDVRKLQRVRKDQTLHEGTIGHRLLMGGFLALQRGEEATVGISDEWGTLRDEIDERWENMPAEAEDELASLHLMTGVVERYFGWADWDGWEILHVEEEFTVTVTEVEQEFDENGHITEVEVPHEVTFTPDLVARDPFGKVWIIDHKTTTSIEEGVPFASQQSLLYLAGVRAHYPEAVGFLFNYLRKKLPTEPRLNKTRHKDTGLYHVNDLNRVDTEYEMLLDFIRAEAPELMDEPSHRQRLAELRDQSDRWFATRRVLANEAALSQIVEETSWVVKDIERSAETGQYPRVLQDDNGYTSCRKCEFESICAAELLDWNTDVVLRDYEPREAKNPYESEDE